MIKSYARFNIFLFTVFNCGLILYLIEKSKSVETRSVCITMRNCDKCSLRYLEYPDGNTNDDKQLKNKTKQHDSKNNRMLLLNGTFGTRHIADTQPTVYVITPTHTRGAQKADLTRLAQTLMLVRNLHWILVEDADRYGIWIEDLLLRTGLRFTHLFVPTPAYERKAKVRGCSQRNKALSWIKHNTSLHSGVIYFADDDNSYDIRLFAEIRTVKKVGIIPTGNLAKTGISSPIIKHGRIVGFVDVWKAGRKFPVEMASMGVNVNFWLLKGGPLFDYRKMGYMETRFLEAMKITVNDLEPKAKNCTEILTWHTNTVKVVTKRIYTNSPGLAETNIPKLLNKVDFVD